MTIHILYEKQKQEFLQKLDSLNKHGFTFYLHYRDKLCKYYLRKKLWKSALWHEAKQTLIELNEFIYGELTCEHCFQTFYGHNKKKICQIHHVNFEYNWKKLFGSGETILVHKHCHKQLTEDFLKKRK